MTRAHHFVVYDLEESNNRGYDTMPIEKLAPNPSPAKGVGVKVMRCLCTRLLPGRRAFESAKTLALVITMPSTLVSMMVAPPSSDSVAIEDGVYVVGTTEFVNDKPPTMVKTLSEISPKQGFKPMSSTKKLHLTI
ncbi:hypothetical protein GUJ93_ZPchr0008g12272 [Zizania palustris]|uniref:Uncharacterized protein n=1 Tax=Zizania palustris TaxID=103762 RepID=A0A8J5REY6_ZIZPA|nr:hypothetical protein GUJ93_ZPchr0008g12272 [Zizania palustris]